MYVSRKNFEQWLVTAKMWIHEYTNFNLKTPGASRIHNGGCKLYRSTRWCALFNRQNTLKILGGQSPGGKRARRPAGHLLDALDVGLSWRVCTSFSTSLRNKYWLPCSKPPDFETYTQPDGYTTHSTCIRNNFILPSYRVYEPQLVSALQFSFD